MTHDALILDPRTVARIRLRFGEASQIADLAKSHERLRAMFAEAAVRISKQSDALSKRAEIPTDEHEEEFESVERMEPTAL